MKDELRRDRSSSRSSVQSESFLFSDVPTSTEFDLVAKKETRVKVVPYVSPVVAPGSGISGTSSSSVVGFADFQC